MTTYTGLAQPIGRYASRLEAAWATQFRCWGWPAKYIGDVCPWADFDVDGVRVEIKPDGPEFVLQSAMRASHILVVEGSPGWATWWAVDEQTAMRIGSPRSRVVRVPQSAEPPASDDPFDPDNLRLRPMRSVRETVHEFVARCGVAFDHTLAAPRLP